ncbi:hypothetical protein BGX24_008832 [Mortierella sp. AD032]|nr:hypothetical protein BGX24_008832 [Mortierella sp. AD032]
MEFFCNSLEHKHHIPLRTKLLRQQQQLQLQHRPARFALAANLHPLSEISTRFIGAKPLASEVCNPSTTDTAMDLESGFSVLFSVSPPSPVESELCSDDQETVVRTWCTAGPTTEQLLGSGEDRAHAFAHVSCTTSQTDSASMTVSAACQGSSPMSASTADPLGKKGTRGSRRGSSENNKKAELYKTELCISVHSGLACKYGDNCQFAHNVSELQHVNRHPRYKTQLCTSFQNQGFCKYNDRCTFIHHPEEARVPISPSLFRKTENHLAANQAPNQAINHQVPNQVTIHSPSQIPYQIFSQMANPMSNQYQAWTAPSSASQPNSGTVSPNQQHADYNKADRVRAMSDPCISSYMDRRSHEMQQVLRMDGLGVEHGFYHEAPMAMDMVNQASQFPHPQVFTIPISNDPHEFMHQGPQQTVPPSMRRQRRMGICYPPGIPIDGGQPVQQRDIVDLLPHYNEHGMFDPDLAAVRPVGTVRPPWMTPSSIWQPLNNLAPNSNTNANVDGNASASQGQVHGQTQNQNQVVPGSLQTGPVEPDYDSEWVSKLGRYITTPQNDFEI